MANIITFTPSFDVSDLYKPKPASFFLPEWYKKTSSYIDGKKELDSLYQTTQTIKRCMPVFDILSTGYIIPTYCDLLIRKKDRDIVYVTSHNQNIEFHPTSQAPYHPNVSENPYPKWINPWGIKTPKGYSVLLTSPFHNPNGFFTVMPAIVDTDTYDSPVNFPFVLDNLDFEGIIPAGTPMVQVIPFKRDSWEMSFGSEEDIKNIKNTNLSLGSMFFDRYKNIFRTPKEYK